ncbi:hypothetical protein H2202_001606 [Exophiala xenobiotica]|nr:hypothetical protein H2202_001606 [Exophiala xenobiotica]KAK5210533.1 hypothetical protein LTR41_004201 [Exophiala xenobiotica]KAK5228247.1 hypothetical protein LTR72_002130 [Exophiala xenobiotica]KAK5238682.1 hypothetical protein LTR47_000425 [Exophiala xenobiotica]KAK5255602.1 hypothetical protein LTS06_000058 [Exophiala xenobiotica]
MSSSSSSSSWQDRRFMFPAGREVHQGSRRYSGSKESADPTTGLATSPSDATTPTMATTTAPPPTPADADAPTSMIGKVLPAAWDGDRRFMGTTPKVIHEGPAARRGSQSSDKSAPIKSSASPPASPGAGIAAAIAGRRRSSASNHGVFSGLMSNRSSKEDYDTRRQSWEDMKSPGGFGGLFSGLVNKPVDKK